MGEFESASQLVQKVARRLTERPAFAPHPRITAVTDLRMTDVHPIPVGDPDVRRAQFVCHSCFSSKMEFIPGAASNSFDMLAFPRRPGTIHASQPSNSSKQHNFHQSALCFIQGPRLSPRTFRTPSPGSRGGKPPGSPREARTRGSMRPGRVSKHLAKA